VNQYLVKAKPEPTIQNIKSHRKEATPSPAGARATAGRTARKKGGYRVKVSLQLLINRYG